MLAVRARDGKGVEYVPRSQAAGREPVALPSSQININNSPQGVFEKGDAEDALAQRKTWYSAADSAPQAISNAQQLRALADTTKTGQGSTIRMQIGSTAQALGIPDAYLPSGFKKQDVASLEQIQQLSRIGAQQALSGPAFSGPKSDNDVRFAQMLAGSAENTPAQLKALATTQEGYARLSQRVADEYDKYEDAQKAAGASPQEIVQRFRRRMLPGILEDGYAQIRKDAQDVLFNAAPEDLVKFGSGSAAGGAASPTAQQPTLSLIHI